MTTYTATGFSAIFTESGLASSFGGPVTFEVIVSLGDNFFTYVVDGTEPGSFSDVTITDTADEVLIDGTDVDSFAGGAGLDAQFGELIWNDGTVRTSYILTLYDPTTDIEYVIGIGGDTLPIFANLTELNNFLSNNLVSTGPASSGSGFEAGDQIFFENIPGVQIEGAGNLINGTPGNDPLDGTSGDDTINGGNGSDTIDGAGGNTESTPATTTAPATVSSAAPATTPLSILTTSTAIRALPTSSCRRA